jgi:hypothetical protein
MPVPVMLWGGFLSSSIFYDSCQTLVFRKKSIKTPVTVAFYPAREYNNPPGRELLGGISSQSTGVSES